MNVGLVGTLNTLKIAHEKGARYIFASTAEVYGDPEVHPQPETYEGNVDPLGVRSQYDESKRGAETLINLFAQKYALDARIIRIFNSYGPGMRLDDGRVINSFLQSLLQDKPLIVHGDGTQTRSFCYLSDTIDGILKVAFDEDLTHAPSMQDRVFNIGNPHEISINEVAQVVQEIGRTLLHKSPSIEYIPKFDLTDPRVRCPDINKAKTRLNFDPKISLRKGLEETLYYFLREY